jgi:uncharacterized membrane protein YozB (DUF420 family)
MALWDLCMNKEVMALVIQLSRVCVGKTLVFCIIFIKQKNISVHQSVVTCTFRVHKSYVTVNMGHFYTPV